MTDAAVVCTVLGGGAYGTALASVLGRKGLAVKMWVREEPVVESINSKHENEMFLTGVSLPESVTATGDLAEALVGTQLVLIVIPTPFLRQFLVRNRTALPANVAVVCCSKGIENETLQTPYEICVEELPGKYHHSLAVLSGPSFAKEVAMGQPTSVLVASHDAVIGKHVQALMSDTNFRVYTGNDMIGAELCGAAKNVIAIACGAASGLGLESNTSALLITRGLQEITQLVVKKGGQVKTCLGLAGVGDLVLTCSSKQSRNFTVGMRIAQGASLEEVLQTNTVAEGVKTSESIHLLAKELGLDLPICEHVYQVLFENKPIKQAILELQTRELKDE